jgi:hypothetical protein
MKLQGICVPSTLTGEPMPDKGNEKNSKRRKKMKKSLKRNKEWVPYFYIVEQGLSMQVLNEAEHLPVNVQLALLNVIRVVQCVIAAYPELKKYQNEYAKLYKSLPKEYTEGNLGIYI